jgi:hypothetical protein
MVAPQLAQWKFPNRDAPWDRHTGAIGILRIRFVPEPSGLVMFMVGAGSLMAVRSLRRFRSFCADDSAKNITGKT